MSVIHEDNSNKFLNELELRKSQALEMIGQMAVAYASALVRVDTGQLRQSITHQVKYDIMTLGVPYWVKYGIYQEVGKSGKYTFRPYIRPAINDHVPQYRQIMIGILQK